MIKEPPQKVRIIIDKMELPGGIPKILDGIPGVDMEFKIIPVGDYGVSDHCAMERKFKDDFENSFIGDEKGKIFRQVRDLVAAYNNSIVSCCTTYARLRISFTCSAFFNLSSNLLISMWELHPVNYNSYYLWCFFWHDYY